MYDRPGSHLDFFIESTWTWSKDDWPPSMTDQDLTYNFKVQNNLHMVKDDWPRRRLLHERPFTHEGNYLILTVSTLSGCGGLLRTDFNSFHFGRVWWSWKNWFWTVSTLGRCVGLERTDFLQFLLWEGVVVLKELILNSFYFEWVWWSRKNWFLTVSILWGWGGLERTDF